MWRQASGAYPDSRIEGLTEDKGIKNLQYSIWITTLVTALLLINAKWGTGFPIWTS
jgi:hypothetical protein